MNSPRKLLLAMAICCCSDKDSPLISCMLLKEAHGNVNNLVL